MPVLKPEEKMSLYYPYVEILKDVRQQEVRSQSDLAIAVGLSHKYVTLVESGKRIPTLECLIALMACLALQRKN